MSWRLAFHSAKLLFSYLIPYKMKVFRDAIISANIPAIRQLANERQRLLRQSIDADGNTALGLALLLGDVDVIKTLLELGCDPNVANAFDGNHPLVILAKLRPEENPKTPILMDLLLDNGSDPLSEVRYQADDAARFDATQTPSYHETPLLCAVRFQNEVLLKKMIEHEIDVNTQNPESGTTPLMLASELGFLHMCNLLLEYGADPTACDHEGNTPLHLAVQGYGDNLPIVETLIQHGADVRAANADGLTPAMLAKQTEKDACFKLLEAEAAKPVAPPQYQEVNLDNVANEGQDMFAFT